MKKFRHVMIVVLMIAMMFSMALPGYASASTELTAAQVKAITPAAKAASYSYSKIKVTWDKIDGLDGYIVYRATSKNGTYSKAFTTTKNSYINTGRTTGKYYYYKVRGYKKIDGKTVYTKYSPVTATYARPNKVKINEVYGNESGILYVTLDWTKADGATGYEQQVNWKRNGKWSGWKTYVHDEYGTKQTFDTYNSLLAFEKKQNDSGYVTTLVDGKVTTLTIEEATERLISKTQAWLEICEDESIYKFRVRAYRTVNGKKVYGAWSDEYTLRETLNKDEILAALRQYTIDYAKKNNPKFIYLDDRTDSTPENSSYYVHGEFGGFSMYAKQEDVIEAYKDNISRYVDRMKTSGGENSGFLYIRKSYPGDAEGISENVTDETYYAIWMLY
ncbi:MAG: hypothetical protein ACI4SU_00650 [Anaerovoracaceae bacterium]